jgi:hypothetical protein
VRGTDYDVDHIDEPWAAESSSADLHRRVLSDIYGYTPITAYICEHAPMEAGM